jgi:hypothetical protein
MEVEINNLGVLLAGLSAMVVGSVWYARGVFGNAWMKLAGLNDKKMQEMRESQGWTPMLAMLVLALVMAYVLAHLAYQAYTFFDVSYMYAAVSTGFWAWLGFVVPSSFGNGLFEGRRKKLMTINAGNWLVTLLVMGWVLGLVGLPS